MSVHKEISKHSENQHRRVKAFFDLDQKREQLIEEEVQKCKENQTISVKGINEVTKQMNELAKQGGVPQRKLVTEQMVLEYVEKLSNRE